VDPLHQIAMDAQVAVLEPWDIRHGRPSRVRKKV
jgi:hypothetical protein